jgi:hypothetical protein
MRAAVPGAGGMIPPAIFGEVCCAPEVEVTETDIPTDDTEAAPA